MDQQESIAVPSVQPASPFMTRFMNVFTSPAELYSEVVASPARTSSWLVPYVLSLLMGCIFTYALFSNQSLRQQLIESRLQGMREQVAAGKMSEEALEKASGFMESPVMFLTIGIAGALVSITLAMFIAPLVLWMISRFILKGTASYKKFLEAYGLSSLTGLLGAVVMLLMMHLLDNFYAQPGGSIFLMNSFNHHSFLHRLMAAVQIFGLWQTAVVGIALAKISGKPTGTGIGLSFGLWGAYVLVASAAGWGMG